MPPTPGLGSALGRFPDFTSRAAVYAIRTYGGVGGAIRKERPYPELRFLCSLQVPNGFGLEGEKLVGMLLLLPAQISHHCTKVKTEPFCIGVPNPADFINDWIVLHGYSSISSSGVQITGHT